MIDDFENADPATKAIVTTDTKIRKLHKEGRTSKALQLLRDLMEQGEKIALIQARTFITKHGVKDMDAYCQQRCHDIDMDIKSRNFD